MNRAILPLLTLGLSVAPLLCWAAEPNADQVTAAGSASTKGLPEARSFIVAAAKEVDKIVDDRDREYLMYELASMQAMVGEIEKAKATASACSITGRRSETYRYIGELQGALGDNEGARTTLVLARKAALAALSSDTKTRSWIGIGLVAVEQARIGDFQGATETLQLIEDAKERDGYQASIAYFQTEQAARRTINQLKDPFQKDLAVRDIVNAEAGSKKIAAAWVSAKEIVDLGLRTSAYITIAEAEGNPNEARRAYAQAKKTAGQLRGSDDKNDFRTVPTSGDREFHEIVASQARTGDIDEAKATATLIREPVERAAALIDIARVQSKASHHQAARTTLANAVTVRTTAAWNSEFMQQLAAALAEAGDLPEAMKTVSLMDEHGEPKGHAYEEIIDVLLDVHKLKQARETVAFLSDPRWKARTLARIGAAESSAGDIASARKTFAEAIAITATVPAKGPEFEWDRSSVYNDVAMRQAETGDFEEVKRWIPLVKEPRDRVSSWLGAAWPLAHRYYDESQKKMVRKAEQGAPSRF